MVNYGFEDIKQWIEDIYDQMACSYPQNYSKSLHDKLITFEILNSIKFTHKKSERIF